MISIIMLKLNLLFKSQTISFQDAFIPFTVSTSQCFLSLLPICLPQLGHQSVYSSYLIENSYDSVRLKEPVS